MDMDIESLHRSLRTLARLRAESAFDDIHISRSPCPLPEREMGMTPRASAALIKIKFLGEKRW